MMREETIYKRAVEKWGYDLQLTMLQEECAELIQAVAKLRRKTQNQVQNADEILDPLAEEIADVEIMIGQMKTMYDWHKFREKIAAQKFIKLERLRDMFELEQGG